ncbi:MAG: hypothetical protein H0W83_12800 [Planctomycetes bacterium]|nr:hypothetical protein [Planctomycetota bacterium]
MTNPDLISLFVQPLNRLRIAYLVTGGVAAVIYGEPRLTRDIDLVLDLRVGDAPRLAGAWPTENFYVPPVEVMAEEAARPALGHFNIMHHETSFRADVYCLGSEDELGAWALRHARWMRIGDDEVAVAPVEYVIVKKLQYFVMGGSDRHLRDIRAVLRVSGDQVDQTELERWLDQLNLRRGWNDVIQGRVDS